LNFFFIKNVRQCWAFVCYASVLFFPSLIYAQDNQEIANQLIQVADEIYANTQAYNQARDAYVQVLDFSII
jgi:hypothetical protein